MSSRLSFGLRSSAVWPLLGIILLVLVNLSHDAQRPAELADQPGFLSITIQDGHLSGSLVDIFNNASRCLILALGMTLVIATSGIDLSVGSVMAIVGAVAATIMGKGTESLTLVLVASLGVALLCGLVNGSLVAWFRVQPIVATLILMVAGRGIAQLVTDGNVIIIKNSAFEFLGNGFIFGLPFAPVLVSALFLLAWAWLRLTAAGLFVEATGDNETASRFAGLASPRIKCLAYVLCGFCAGIAGLLTTAYVRSADPYTTGLNMELDAIFAVVVGGTALSGGRFNLLGSYLGAFLLQTLTTTMYNIGVPPAIAPVPKAFLIITVCLLQSETTRRWFTALRRRRAVA